jgi:hypothetical protein
VNTRRNKATQKARCRIRPMRVGINTWVKAEDHEAGSRRLSVAAHPYSAASRFRPGRLSISSFKNCPV